jgi:outer membrane lipoprotein-sorting protein
MKSCFKKRLYLLLVLGFFPVIQPVFAMASPQAEASHQATLKEIEGYLNRIQTLQANFVQHNPNGETTTGRMFLNRRGLTSFGKLRLEYAPPAKIRIIADGEILRYEDREKGEVNDYSIDSTPASFLLRHQIEFTKGDLKAQKLATKDGKVYLDLVRSEDEGAVLTLIFVTNPFLRLQGWIVLDGQGNKTHVTLSNVEIGMPLDDKLFVIK